MQPAQPFHVHVALKTRQQQPQRIACCGRSRSPSGCRQHGSSRHFSIGMLRVSAPHRRLRDHPFSAACQPRLLQHELQTDRSIPRSSTDRRDRTPSCEWLGVGRIAGAFEEMDTRLRRKRRKSSIVKISGRSTSRAASAGAAPDRCRNAAMMAFVEQPVRRDDASGPAARARRGGRYCLRFLGCS